MEERYPVNNKVEQFELFLCKAKKELVMKLRQNEVKDADKCRAYIAMIDDILELDEMAQRGQSIRALIDKVRVHYAACKLTVAEREMAYDSRLRELENVKYRYAKIMSYAIPDEQSQYDIEYAAELLARLTDVSEKARLVQKAKKRADLLHNLLGVLHRPKGFFENI